MKRLPVTDHAVLRYLERMGYVDVEAVRAHIHAETRDAINAGASKITSKGVEYRINHGKVVTLMPSAKPNRPTIIGRRPHD